MDHSERETSADGYAIARSRFQPNVVIARWDHVPPAKPVGCSIEAAPRMLIGTGLRVGFQEMM
jgi:hypothetical protein